MKSLPRLALASFSLAALAPWAVLRAAPATPPAIPLAKMPDASKVGVPELPGGSHRFEDLFAPLRTDFATLSPDGKLLAYPARRGSKMSIVVVAADQPGKAKTVIDVLTDEDATPMLGNNKERTPARIEWLRWASANRLVVQSNAQPPVHNGDPGTDATAASPWYSVPGVVIAFDADGSNPKTLVTPRDLALKERVPPPPPKSEFDIPTPDQASEDAPAITDSGSTTSADATIADQGDSATVTDNTIMTVARRPQVVDLVPGDPDSIYVRAEDPTASRDRVNRAELFKVNVRTGAIASLSEEVLTVGNAVLLDRQGHRAVTVPNTTQVSFPHVFTYDPADKKKNGAKRSLDSIVGSAGGGFSVSPENYFGERSEPVGFDDDSSTLYFASNVGHDTYGFYSLDLKTGKRGGVAFENPILDLYQPTPARFASPSPLVFDRYSRKLAGIRIIDQLGTTRWVRPELQAVQAMCEKALPGRSIEIQEWDEAAHHFLIVARGPTDPGAYYLLDATTNQLTEFISRAPALDRTKTFPTLSVVIKTPDGARLTGLVTSPRNPRLKPVPVVVLCQSEPWLRVSPEYNPAVAALAEMGLLVVQVNPRCAWGSGTQQRLLATQNGFEDGASQDIVTMLDWVQKHFEVSTKRVGIIGERRGAYLALRTLQLHPNRFRCMVGIEPTIDLGGWMSETRWNDASSAPALTRAFFGSKDKLKEAPLLAHPETVKASVLLLSYRGEGKPETFAHSTALKFAAAVRRTGETATVTDLDDDYIARLPSATAGVFRDIETFINENIYNFSVNVGELETKKD